MGGCEARTAGSAHIDEIRVRPRTTPRAAQRGPAAQVSIVSGPFNRVLVANRGEVAVRVIRALHELDIEAVAVYSTIDEDSLHVRLADRAVCIGPAAAGESYLRIPSVIAAANTTGCQAAHPGWGSRRERCVRRGMRRERLGLHRSVV